MDFNMAHVAEKVNQPARRLWRITLVKYLLYSFLGVCLGLVLGALGGHFYTLHLYTVTVAADPVREDDLWGLVDMEKMLSGGLAGAGVGLAIGLVCAWQSRMRL